MRMRRKIKKPGFKMHREKKRVAILTPCNDMIHAEFALALIAMIQYTHNANPENLESLSVLAIGTSVLPKGRQDLTEQALANGATHILWIDSDMSFPKDTLLNFLRRDEKIIGANCLARRPPYSTTCRYADRTGVETTSDSTGLEKIASVGFGVLWVATEVFERMERPFYNFSYFQDTQSWAGEDFNFMSKVRALGYEVYCDHDLSKGVYHIGSFRFNPLQREAMEVGK